MRKRQSLGLSLFALIASTQSVFAFSILSAHPCNSELLTRHYLEDDNTLDCDFHNSGKLVTPADIDVMVRFGSSNGKLVGFELFKETEIQYVAYYAECRPKKAAVIGGGQEFSLTPKEQALYANSFECDAANEPSSLQEETDTAEAIALYAGASCAQAGLGDDPKKCQYLIDANISHENLTIGPVETFYCPTDIQQNFLPDPAITEARDPQRTALRKTFMRRCWDATLAMRGRSFTTTL